MTPRQETESYIAEAAARIKEQTARVHRFIVAGRDEEARAAQILLEAMTDKLHALRIRLSAIQAGERRQGDTRSPEQIGSGSVGVSRAPAR